MLKIAKSAAAAAFSILAAALLLSAPQAAAQNFQDIIESKEIRLGIIPYDPLVIKDPKSGELSGVFIDAVRRVFAELKVDPIFVETKWGTFAGALQSGQIDVFIGGSFATPQRAMAIEFTRPAFFIGFSASARKENAHRFSTVEDLNSPDVTIATALGGSPHDYAKQHLPKAKIVALDTGDLTAGGMAVLAKRVDVALEDAFAIAKFVRTHPDDMVDLFADKPFNVLPVSWAVAPGNPRLMSFLNTFLDYMETNGAWQKAAKPYGVTGLFVPQRQYRPLGEQFRRLGAE